MINGFLLKKVQKDDGWMHNWMDDRWANEQMVMENGRMDGCMYG